MAKHFRPVLLVVGCGWALVLGCALSDLFSPSGVAELSLTYVGADTVVVGGRTSFSIQVRAGGAIVANPRVRVMVLDTSKAVIRGDSLIGCELGTTDLTANFINSILADSTPQLIQPIRVRPPGGPPLPPDPACPT